MRTEKSIKNLIYAIVGQIFGILISFVSRIIFIKILSTEYLGVNGLFTNILTILSLVELGVGSAMIFNLYKPLAINDKEHIKSLMMLYKKAYSVIGILVILLGVLFTPIYPYLINEVPNIPNLNLIYILFVLNTGISYFYSYKRSLIICDQKRYIATIFRYAMYFILNIVQIVVLLFTKNYILFLIAQVLFTWLENVFISKKADKMYPYLLEKDVQPIKKKELKEIKRNIKAMMFHKIGGVIVNSTDNILLSRLVGITSVGLYSNYYMITNALETIIMQFFNSIVASIGNLNAKSDKKRLQEVFDKVFFLNFAIFCTVCTCLFNLMNPFIKIWIGKEYMFSIETVATIIICFYLKGMRRSCLTFRDALGIFWYDRYKPIAESIINLVASIILGSKYGVTGIFIGTIISTITTSLWVEPYVLYKYGFNDKLKKYIIQFSKYTVTFVFIFTITTYICNYISGTSILFLLIKAIICFIISLTFITIVYFKSPEFKYYIYLVKKIVKPKRSKV